MKKTGEDKLESLELAVNKGFQDLDHQMNSLNRGFQELNRRMDSSDRNLNEFRQIVLNWTKKMDMKIDSELNPRIEGLAITVGRHDSDIIQMKKAIGS